MAAFPNIGKLLANYRARPSSALERTPMDNGLPKQIKTKSRVLQTGQVTYRFTGAELLTFRTFVDTTLNMGADWFDWVDPVAGATVQVRIVNGDWQENAVSAEPGAELQWDVAFALESWR